MIRNEHARRLLEKTPESTKQWVRKYAYFLLDKSIIGRIKLWWFIKTTKH